MARLSTASQHTPSSSAEKGVAELNQLLRRLDQTILHADEGRERRLRASEFERARLNSNLNYARSLLTRIEQEAMHIKLLSRRQDMQADLNRKRELLERLVDRMHDLEQLHEEDDDNSSGSEDILADIIPTPSESMDSRSTGIPTDYTGDQDEDEDEEPEIPDLPPPVSALPTEPSQPPPAATASEAEQPLSHQPPETTAEIGTTTTQSLRSRGPIRPDSPTAATTATARAALFASRRSNTSKSAASAPASSTATAEAILDHQRAEQDALSESILKMASALKASSQKFSDTLEQDKNVVSRAADGMDKTERSMDAASRRMGTLRKMTEGKGWWGRMILYAWVYGLMVGLILVVFVMPKLRF
ncbi:synaptobrevin [Colletotrichum graminicola M1.001]|uniref:Synaptobrevin n=1 Tax=Colletotrichum graminicola (strain M1.001 / M2 / FGSC 10212) TaxID=645133 RepID=E3Q370_COLGM|nr:synaptobrevin [Colletotrichum graminicola M1.001]EFQ25049.1 synaptobrevin [Colletotrichum graminicola M1.001]